jgi:hypothetical protein
MDELQLRFDSVAPLPAVGPLESNVLNLAKDIIGKESTTSVNASVAATISRHAIFSVAADCDTKRVL